MKIKRWNGNLEQRGKRQDVVGESFRDLHKRAIRMKTGICSKRRAGMVWRLCDEKKILKKFYKIDQI
jgi:hypothetical protein